ncbi:MAG TPA: AI-2E family transporter [Cytophagaceae bacterium]|jgi:predicted PurR-regulated permease PerM
MEKNYLYRATLLLLFLFLFFSGLYYARDFIVPIAISILLAMVLLPITKRLEKAGVPRLISVILCLLVIIGLIAGIIILFYSQVVAFAQDLPHIKVTLIEKFKLLQNFVESKTNISAQQQMNWIELRYNDLINSSGQYVRMLLMGITGGLAIFGLIIFYILFFLLYRVRINNFFLQLVSDDKHAKVESIICKITDLIQHYLTGLLIELAVLGTLNAIGLLILGIRQAIFLGYLAGLLNIIPYVGSMIGSIFPIMMALIFGDSLTTVVAVMALMATTQFIDNNILTPKIIGSHIQINPLVTIMGIVSGGFIWGIPGMIMFVPLLGIFKIICDNLDPLKPIGYLLGDDAPTSNTGLLKRIKNLFHKTPTA